MSINFNLKITGNDEVLGNLSRLKFLATENLRDIVNEAAVNVQKGAKRRVTVDTGRLRSSIRFDFDNRGFTGTVGTDVKYAPTVEFGRSPGTWPPKGSLLDWMRRVGIPAEREFSIRQAIFRNGTKPQPFLFPAWEEEKPKFIKRLQQIIKKTIRKVTD